MEVTNNQKIGTYFKKENIFLATISCNNTDTKENLSSTTSYQNMESLFSFLVDVGAISSEQYDIFYKDDAGYTCFSEEGPETFVGDNSDGKGIILNIVPIWEYYSEEQVFECKLNNDFMAIGVFSLEPLYQYNRDFNLN